MRAMVLCVVLSASAGWAQSFCKNREPGPDKQKEAPALLKKAKAFLDKQQFDDAIPLLQTCAAFGDLTCVRTLASTWAKVGQIRRDTELVRYARDCYEWYVALAPPDDSYVRTVKKILAAAH